MSDQNNKFIAPRFLSLFGWGRPPLPWSIADTIAELLQKHGVARIGVTGSLSPSVLVAIGYGDPKRQVNAFARSSLWEEGMGWNDVIEDSPNMELSRPWANPYLPTENVHFWDGASPFFYSDALFVDLPFSHPQVGLKIEHLKDQEYRLILCGFLESHDGPTDVLDWCASNGYATKEHAGVITNVEKSESLTYRLVAATR